MYTFVVCTLDTLDTYVYVEFGDSTAHRSGAMGRIAFTDGQQVERLHDVHDVVDRTPRVSIDTSIVVSARDKKMCHCDVIGSE